MQFADRFISKIYDCAANPELWTDTLTQLRDHMGAAYVMVGLTDIAPLLRGEPPLQSLKYSPWDVNNIRKLGAHIRTMPGYQNLFNTEVDHAWVQMHECTEAEFQQTEFFRECIAPQNLRDAINAPFFRRPSTVGVLTVTSYMDRELFTRAEANMVAELSPHIRRAVAISDLVDQNRHMMALYQRVLDQLATAVFVIGHGQHIKFANAAAETLLSSGAIVKKMNGALMAAKDGASTLALEEAMLRAAQGDVSLGIKGIGIPLTSITGERAAAYVLPITGKDVRGAMGDGFCAVFVAQRGEQLPMTIEVLRTVYDLSQAEARVAALIAKGDSAETIADALGTSVHTVRTQIAKALAKTQTANQIALVARIHELVPPLMS
jgi:DNA-binding CsgD family transcriptional regulator/PAS domain-containing protein